jgi:hypothetical protein
MNRSMLPLCRMPSSGEVPPLRAAAGRLPWWRTGWRAGWPWSAAPWGGRGVTLGLLSALGTLGALGGCATAAPPNEAMAVATAAVNRASSGPTAAQAPIELRRAVDKLAAARVALSDGRNVEAQRLAEQADVDAQVAEMQAQRVRSVLAAQESDAAARALREELQRKTGR